MHKLSKIALLAVVAGLTVVPAAMAAPSFTPQQKAAFCASHPQDPQCDQGGGQNQGSGQNHGRTPNNGNAGTVGGPPGGAGQAGTPPPPPMGGHGPGPGGPGPGGMGFHQRFGGFNFGSFGVPGFSITIGGQVPHSYNSLRPVPRSVYKYYPQYRGYLFFVGRHGDFVIVSPRSHRIVAVL